MRNETPADASGDTTCAGSLPLLSLVKLPVGLNVDGFAATIMLRAAAAKVAIEVCDDAQC
jgi:hypothetical protein